MEPASPQLRTKQPRRKRNRTALSCGHCRVRKLKCNRATPCEACIKAGDATTCSYGSHERREKDQLSMQLMDRDVLTSRIDRLEGLLMSVMSNTNHHSSTNPSSGVTSSSVSQSPNVSMSESNNPRSNIARIGQEDGKEAVDMELFTKEFGVMRVDDPTQTVYHGGQHWVSTMFQIQEFRDYLEANSDDLGRVAFENRKTRGGNENFVSLLRGTNAPLTKEILLSYIPSRVVTDMLIARFFDYVSHSIPVVHEPTFRQEYVQHWENPNQTEITWLGLLFSILHHAQLSFDKNEENHSQSCTAQYRQRTVQCLIAANYTEPRMYTVELLILHIYAEWMSSQDGNVDVSLLLGIAIRLAMRMGMHRDSRAYGVALFHGEMRRRVWATIRTMDIICSFQLSLPATIHHGDSRCAVPRNIFNDEFYKDIKELPPPRPLSEATEISFTIIKTRLTLELGKILVFVEFEDDPTHDDISKYEQSLEEVKRMIPKRLNVSSTQEFGTVSAGLHRQRIDVDRLYQASQCVLHRKSLSQARHDSSKLQHRGMCIDAAMTLLAHQTTLHSDLNSSYHQEIRKRHICTLTTHDFFTASMAVALDLHYGFESEPYTPSPSDVSLWGYDRREEMITALETSTEFCRMSRDESVEAANAYGMLAFVVAKARKAQWMIAEQQGSGNSSTSAAGQISGLNTAATVSELGAEIFNDSLPDFDWNLWNQFKGNDEELQLLTQWEDITSCSVPGNERPL